MTKHRILVVDDDYDILGILNIYLSNLGYDMATAETGEDALELVASTDVDLIVLEVNLPDMSGYDVCRELRTNSDTKHIPIIFLTEKDERGDKITSIEMGADDYVTKPFDIEEIKLRVANAIKYSQGY